MSRELKKSFVPKSEKSFVPKSETSFFPKSEKVLSRKSRTPNKKSCTRTWLYLSNILIKFDTDGIDKIQMNTVKDFRN